jgi:hypothetical protein
MGGFHMKSLFKTLLASLLVIGCVYGTAHAQIAPDLSIWDTVFWQMKKTVKGYYFSSDSVNSFSPWDEKVTGSSTQWGILVLDSPGNLHMDLHETAPNGDCALVETLYFAYIAGSELDFLVNFLQTPGGNLSTGLLNIKGKTDSAGTGLKSAKIESLAGYVRETGFVSAGDIAAFGMTLKGKLVKELGCFITK